MDDWTKAPCGCGFGIVGDAFVIEPCSLSCDVCLYALSETQAQGKPVTQVTV